MTDIKLDIDDKHGPFSRGERLAFQIPAIRKMTGIFLYLDSVTETAHGYHVRLHTAVTLEDYEIIILQLMLGSDWARECWNYGRVLNGESMNEWNVLFEKKWKRGPDGSKTVISQERRSWLSVVFEIGFALSSATGAFKQALRIR